MRNSSSFSGTSQKCDDKLLHGKWNSAVFALLWGYCLSAWRVIIQKQFALCSLELLMMMMIRQGVSTIIGHMLCLQWLRSSLSAFRLSPSFVAYKGEYRVKNEPEVLLAVLATRAQAPIHIRYGLTADQDTVNSLTATTCCKRPLPVSDHFVNDRFVSQAK